MSAGAGERQFDATPQRIARALRDGNVARAQEFGANAAVAGAVVATLAVAPRIGGAARAAMVAAAHGDAPLGDFAAILGLALVPMACAAAAAACAGIVQSGGIRVVAVVPKLERIDPLAGLKRICSRETLAQILRASIAFAVAALVVWPVARGVLGAALGRSGVLAGASIAWNGAFHVVFATMAIGALFAAGEYATARRTWLRKLRMTYEEFKREIKERDGDPLLRGRRKALHRAMARGSLGRVREAAFVIANPTHVAIALDYRPPQVPVPTVLVRALDEAALRVRELAAEYGVPVVENVALARALYRDGAIDRPIPSAHYVAVAEIVAALARAGVLGGPQ